ncbi:hypothetical protein Tco_0911796, partial [Tanacetum coccineum]
MDTTRAQQKALDDELFAPANHALKLTSFYKAFDITADVPEIYMQEFWVTASRHHSLLCFKMNGKIHTVNVDNFRDMLYIFPKLPGRKFKDSPFEEEILSFIRHLGHISEIKVLSDVNVNHMHQPWRSFAAIINKCLSGKTTTLESLRLSRAQILWDMYHNKNVDYVYLLWEELVYQDLSIPRRNKMFWHTSRDEPMFTTIRALPQHLTNQAMLESEAYKTYHDYATGEKIPKPKYVKNKADLESSPKKKSAQASKGKRIKTSTKVAKPVKKNQPATTSKEKGLNVLSKVALFEAEHIKLATKRSLIQTHSSHASSSGVDKGIGVIQGVPDVPTYNSDDEQISWKSSDEDDDDEVNVSEDNDNQNDDNADNEDDDKVNVSEDDDDQNDDNVDNEGDADQDDDNEQTKSDNDDDDLVHPKLSTFDEKERQDEEDKEEEWSDDEAYDDETQGVSVDGEELDEEETNEEDKVKELYRDMNVNLEGRDTEMTDAPQTNIQGFTSNMLNPNSDTGIDSILNLNTESTSLVDVLVSMNVEMPPSSVTPLPPPPIPFIQPQQQTPVSTPTIVLTVSSVPGIVDTYLANKMNEAVKTIVQIQSDRLRDEAQAENED